MVGGSNHWQTVTFVMVLQIQKIADIRTKAHKITYNTVLASIPNQETSCTEEITDKWIMGNDKELDIFIWLKFKMAADNCKH